MARAESDRGELVLRERPAGRRRADLLELRANGVFVMDTVEVSTERRLASAALGAGRPAAGAVLVGGLGLGYTLHELLADPRGREVHRGRDRAGAGRWLRDGLVAATGRRCSPTSGWRSSMADIVVAPGRGPAPRPTT